ncbi:hypothetical protein CORC01_05629 [Colletotrichum orchidophilum]|uniref:Uncharacterized protein n=1 Tax=Colletotrichum orchidophilum TaxID=1209926 RepID=A0A1G4BCR1_9PEZI|nr:uncharacterized protein CORC01_05629 [Colletotrichum orchidophilum]OHE99136.1 hypothetical protein CORC01_05629 [Colletotrichum orchidophilum]
MPTKGQDPRAADAAAADRAAQKSPPHPGDPPLLRLGHPEGNLLLQEDLLDGSEYRGYSVFYAWLP